MDILGFEARMISAAATKTNGYGCVSVKLYLKNKQAGQICQQDVCHLPTCDIEAQSDSGLILGVRAFHR